MAVDDTFTKALLHMDGADGSTTFTDESGKIWTAAGNAQIDTAQSVFGGASGLFDGSGDYVYSADNADWCTDSGDATWDFRLRVSSLPSAYKAICGQRLADGGEDAFVIWIDDSNKIRAYWTNSSGTSYNVISNSAISANTWYHIAVVLVGGVLKLAIDGVFQTSAATVSGSHRNSSSAFAIGRQGEYNNYYFNGWIDEFRYSKGIARWTANFTPPATAYVPILGNAFWKFARR